MNFAHYCLFLSSVKKGMGLNKSVFCHFHMVAEVCDLPLLLRCCWLVYCLVMVSLRADLTQSISLFRRSTTGWSVASVASFPSCYLVPRDCRACAVLLAHPANASCSGSKYRAGTEDFTYDNNIIWVYSCFDSTGTSCSTHRCLRWQILLHPLPISLKSLWHINWFGFFWRGWAFIVLRKAG